MTLASSLVADLNAKAKAKADEAADKARTAARIAGVGVPSVLVDASYAPADIGAAPVVLVEDGDGGKPDLTPPVLSGFKSPIGGDDAICGRAHL